MELEKRIVYHHTMHGRKQKNNSTVNNQTNTIFLTIHQIEHSVIAYKQSHKSKKLTKSKGIRKEI